MLQPVMISYTELDKEWGRVTQTMSATSKVPRQSDVALVKERLKLTQKDYEERYG